MEGIPAHDDQGSYDRPHDLTVTFDKGKIDGASPRLGLKPWTEARPPIVLFVGVRNGDVAFVLSADAEQGASMREALAAAGVRTGLAASVPSRRALDEAGLTVATLPAADAAMLDEIARRLAVAGLPVRSRSASRRRAGLSSGALRIRARSMRGSGTG